MNEFLHLTRFDPETIVFAVFLSLSMLITLYAILMIHQKLRILESEIQDLRKDETVMSQEIEMLAQMKPKAGAKPKVE